MLNEIPHTFFQPFPITEKLIFSACLYLFSMSMTTFYSQDFDAILHCVDRLSVCLTASPTLKFGLTAEKAAHLMLDKVWNAFVIPGIVHSDIVPNFVGQWLQTMCTRLCILRTHSPHTDPELMGVHKELDSNSCQC